MSSQTTYYNLIKPAGNENYDVTVFNGNADKIDSTMKTISNWVENLESKFGIPSTSESDLNNAKAPGFHRAGSSTSNTPTTGYYAVMVIPFSASDLAQIAVEVNTAKMYVRAFHDGTTWTSWKTVVS